MASSATWPSVPSRCVNFLEAPGKARQGWHLCRLAIKNQSSSVGATSSEYVAPTGLKFCWGCGSTNMPRLTALETGGVWPSPATAMSKRRRALARPTTGCFLRSAGLWHGDSQPCSIFQDAIIPFPNENRLFRERPPPLPPCGHPLLHSAWRRGAGRGGTWSEYHRLSLGNRGIDMTPPSTTNCGYHPLPTQSVGSRAGQVESCQ